MEQIEFFYREFKIYIVKDSSRYRYYNDAEQILSIGFRDLGEAIEKAIIKADEDLEYYSNYSNTELSLDREVAVEYDEDGEFKF